MKGKEIEEIQYVKHSEDEALPVGKRISSLWSRSRKKKQPVREAEKRFSESLKNQQTTVSQRP